MTICNRTERLRRQHENARARIAADLERRRSAAAGVIDRTPPRTSVRQALRAEMRAL